jgi:P-type E1-E2 ATPase
VVFDKTGTLTRGRPALRELVALAPLSPAELLRLAAAVERRSEHHLGRAVVEAARALPDGAVGAEPAVEGFRAHPGLGVTAQVEGEELALGNRALMAQVGVSVSEEVERRAEQLESAGDTVVFLGRSGRIGALLAIADLVRPEAAEAVAELRALGCRVSLLSGDHRTAAEAAALRLGIEQVAAEVSPAGKRERVAAGQREGRRVLAVGDGINDAPVLGQADVGLAMGRGADVTLESADAVLVREDLRLVPEAVRLSRLAGRIIRQNVFWALAYNAVAVPLAMAGLLHPVVAAAAMAASSAFVAGNSLRLRRAGGPARRPGAPGRGPT